MNPQLAYDRWAARYDTDANRTRDLEALALRETLDDRSFDRCLEIGCGTGKNTVWLADRTGELLAVDLSQEMLEAARQKVISDPARQAHVQFQQADLRQPWSFAEGRLFDLVTFSLVLEHIEYLPPVFEKVAAVLSPGGLVYVGELHPFKQYTGTKARFDTEEGRQVVACFNHHISDFVGAAGTYGLRLSALREYFDEDDRTRMPRILTLVFQKP
ncbi:class I SAM-dependent methyltransferase [Larkinella soli]|uniref:class I SAM-dependent methyltransferase n=1 Tax=Larkinella soli TaxID=1770527 RepID=UPI000FFB6D7A|nr:class I SAM-dependent methyltransferase [Larkinella soli]